MRRARCCATPTVIFRITDPFWFPGNRIRSIFSRMGKAFLFIAIGLVVLLVAGFLILTVLLDSIVKSNIERIGTEMTGTRVTTESVSISPFSGEGTIGGLRIANPVGYAQDFAMEVDNLFIRLDVRSLLSDEIVVREVRITSPVVYVEQKLPDNNLATIRSSIRAAASRGTSSDATLVIEQLFMETGTVNLYTRIGGERSERFEISSIELSGLGRGDQKEQVEDVVQQIAEEVVRRALQSAVQSGFDQLREVVRDLFN